MVKCAECGFLAVRYVISRELGETEESFRKGGPVPTIDQYGGRPMPQHELQPLCFVQRYDLRSEFRKASGEDIPDSSSIQKVIHEDRQCDEFTEWQQGFTPKEHREMLDRQEFRNWQERQEFDNSPSYPPSILVLNASP